MDAIRDDVPLHFLAGGVSFKDAAAQERHPVVRTGPRPPLPARLRREVIHRDRFTCQLCLQRGGTLEVDHIVPWSAGGEDTATNLRTLCQDCNQERSNLRYPGNPQPLPIADCNRCAARSDSPYARRAWCPECRSIGTSNTAATELPRAVGPSTVTCPYCQASPHEPCRRAGRAGTDRDVPMQRCHPSRKETAQNQ